MNPIKLFFNTCKFLAVMPTILLLASCATKPTTVDITVLKKEVTATESAFAKTMADRNHLTFTNFISNEAVFFSGPTASVGKIEISELWKQYFATPEAPFSWKPERVEVLASGTLAMSSGPVYDNHRKKVATFNSVWRLEAPGVWRIIFDKGGANECLKN